MENRSRRQKRILLGASLLVVAVALLVSFDDVRTYGGEDLRPRVLGARALLSGLDPYTYEVTPQTPETLLDHTRPFARITRATYSPALLFLYGPLSDLPWGAQRAIWAALEWAALFGTVLVLALCLRRPRDRVALCAVASLCFAGSYFFRLHVERGQYYVFLALLLSLWCAGVVGRAGSRGARPGTGAGTGAGPGESPWAGVPLGIAIALRPSLAVLIPLAFLLGLRRSALGAILAALALAGLTLPLAGVSGWLHFVRHAGLIGRWALRDPATLALLGKPVPVPAVLEGHDFSRLLPGLSGNTAIGGVLQAAFAGSSSALETLRSWWPRVSPLLALGAVAATLALVLWGGLRRRAVTTRLALALVAALLVDYCLPIRISYADVLFLPPLALLLPALLSRRLPRVFPTLILTGFICGAAFATVSWKIGYPGALIRSALVMIGLLGACVWLSFPRRFRA